MSRKPNYGPETRELIDEVLTKLKTMGVDNIREADVLEAAVKQLSKNFKDSFVSEHTPIEYKLKTLSGNEEFKKQLDRLTRKFFSEPKEEQFNDAQ